MTGLPSPASQYAIRASPDGAWPLGELNIVPTIPANRVAADRIAERQVSGTIRLATPIPRPQTVGALGLNGTLPPTQVALREPLV